MTISDIPKDKQIVLFDGVCNLCDCAVRYIIRHDRKDAFRFLPLQSELGRAVAAHIGIGLKATDSIILYLPGKAYFLKSDAALRIAKALGLPMFSAIVGLLPKWIRDHIYDYIARNRYKWYGRNDACMLPSPEVKSKFLA
jgi:predicted DCC family thiol-disulfide oxidoreductase YuxK